MVIDIFRKLLECSQIPPLASVTFWGEGDWVHFSLGVKMWENMEKSDKRHRDEKKRRRVKGGVSRRSRRAV